MTRASLPRAAALVLAFLLLAGGVIGFLIVGISFTGAAPKVTPTASPAPTEVPPSPTADPTPTASPTPELTPTPIPTPALVAAPLTGRLVTQGQAEQQVVAVMIDDAPAARPQSGLSAASVVWQAPAEGGVPRYIALFQEQMPVSVGPIRSARSYFIAWAAEWRAVYAHVGGSPRALATLATYGRGQYVYNADRWGTRYFWRIKERYAPHNVYSDGEHLRKLSAAVGAKDGPMEPVWRFAADAPFTERPRDGRIVVKYADNAIRYDYDRLTNTYLRTVSTEGPEEDAGTGARVAPRNVIVMLVRFTSLGDRKHRLEADLIGSGTAWIATNGKTIKGTWEKTKTTGPTLFYDAKGRPVTLTIGQTFVQVMQTGSSITIEDGKVPLPPTMPTPGAIATPL